MSTLVEQTRTNSIMISPSPPTAYLLAKFVLFTNLPHLRTAEAAAVRVFCQRTASGTELKNPKTQSNRQQSCMTLQRRRPFPQIQVRMAMWTTLDALEAFPGPTRTTHVVDYNELTGLRKERIQLVDEYGAPADPWFERSAEPRGVDNRVEVLRP